MMQQNAGGSRAPAMPRRPADRAPSRRQAWRAPCSTACLVPTHHRRSGSCACLAHRWASSTSPRAHRGAAPVAPHAAPVRASAPWSPRAMPSWRSRRWMRCWKVEATWVPPRAVASSVAARCYQIRRAEWAKVALANRADAPCPQRHFSRRPAAGQSRRSSVLRPTTYAAGKSFLRPTPSRGPPDGATTRYGKQTSAFVNTSLLVNHKNLWKTG
jgi:hypothetical protein